MDYLTAVELIMFVRQRKNTCVTINLITMIVPYVATK
jgi:hypothetical protein